MPINKRYEKRETKREAKALIAAKLETAIEKELLTRLQAGTYKEIYNIAEKQFNKALDTEQIEEKQYEVDEDLDDDSLIGADFDSQDEEEEGELELEEDEIAELDAEEAADREDLENAGESSTKIGSKRGRSDKSNGVSLNYEYEFENEEEPKEKIKASSKRRAASKSTASRESIDF